MSRAGVLFLALASTAFSQAPSAKPPVNQQPTDTIDLSSGIIISIAPHSPGESNAQTMIRVIGQNQEAMLIGMNRPAGRDKLDEFIKARQQGIVQAPLLQTMVISSARLYDTTVDFLKRGAGNVSTEEMMQYTLLAQAVFQTKKAIDNRGGLKLDGLDYRTSSPADIDIGKARALTNSGIVGFNDVLSRLDDSQTPEQANQALFHRHSLAVFEENGVTDPRVRARLSPVLVKFYHMQTVGLMEEYRLDIKSIAAGSDNRDAETTAKYGSVAAALAKASHEEEKAVQDIILNTGKYETVEYHGVGDRPAVASPLAGQSL